MSARTHSLRATSALLVITVLLAVAVIFSVVRPGAVPVSPEPDVATQLADIQRRAAQGTLTLLASHRSESALIDAGFPPRRPAPKLSPRARFAGATVVPVRGVKVAAAVYESDTGAFTLLTLPATAGAPPDASRLIRGGVTFHVLTRAEVTVVLWQAGNWYYGLASTFAGAERDGLLELVRRGQGLAQD